VGVLAVMDRALSACEAHTARTVYVGGDECFKRICDNYGLPEARAAVAELIDKAAEAEKVIRNLVAANQIHMAYGDYADDLRAALARVGGAE
jgi:hypothetical protein